MTGITGALWKETGYWVQPNDARSVMNVIGSIGVYSTGQQFAWRGMSSADFALTSSLHRATNGGELEVRTAEQAILRESREWGLGTHPTGQVDDLQLLSDLQHFGIPTRLIDVTSNPMTALWFASRAAPTGHANSGLLLALNITNWPRVSTVSEGDITRAQLGNPLGARLAQQLDEGRPFVVDSASPNPRLRAQEGFFLTGAVPDPSLFGDIVPEPFKSLDIRPSAIDHDELESRLTADRGRGAPRALPFVAIIIKQNLKERLSKYLQGTYNRSARVLFPDYLGYLQYGQSIHALT